MPRNQGALGFDFQLYILGYLYCTTWFTTEDVLFAEAASPRYCAVIGCAPTASVDFVSLATPPFNLTDPIPIVPSLNVTLPVGVCPADVTVAVKVTA